MIFFHKNVNSTNDGIAYSVERDIIDFIIKKHFAGPEKQLN